MGSSHDERTIILKGPIYGLDKTYAHPSCLSFPSGRVFSRPHVYESFHAHEGVEWGTVGTSAYRVWKAINGSKCALRYSRQVFVVTVIV